MGASQTVTVRFGPTVVGSPGATVNFGVTGGAPVARTVSGIGVGCGTIPIALGATVNGNLAESDCASSFRPGAKADRYSFAGTAGQQLTITMSAPGSFLDTYLFLVAPAGNVLAQSDDCGFDLSSCINSFTLPTTGTYTIEATSFSPLARGAYTLTISPSALLVVSPASQDFGTVTIGGVADRSFTVTNSGAGVLTGSATVAAPFSVIAGGSYSLGSGASQQVTISSGGSI